MLIKLFKLFIPVFNGMNIQQFLDILRLVERETKEKKNESFNNGLISGQLNCVSQ